MECERDAMPPYYDDEDASESSEDELSDSELLDHQIFYDSGWKELDLFLRIHTEEVARSQGFDVSDFPGLSSLRDRIHPLYKFEMEYYARQLDVCLELAIEAYYKEHKEELKLAKIVKANLAFIDTTRLNFYITFSAKDSSVGGTAKIYQAHVYYSPKREYSKVLLVRLRPVADATNSNVLQLHEPRPYVGPEPRVDEIHEDEHHINHPDDKNGEGFDVVNIPGLTDAPGSIFQLDEFDLQGYYEELNSCVELAKDAYFKSHNEKLKNVKVLKASIQSTTGLMFYITFKAKDSSGGKAKTYQTRVNYSYRPEREESKVLFVRLKPEADGIGGRAVPSHPRPAANRAVRRSKRLAIAALRDRL